MVESKKHSEESRSHIVWESSLNEERQNNSTSRNVVPFPQRVRAVKETTHQVLTIEPGIRPIRIISSGFGNIRGINSNTPSCAA